MAGGWRELRLLKGELRRKQKLLRKVWLQVVVKEKSEEDLDGRCGKVRLL